jgi:hypothetical protein
MQHDVPAGVPQEVDGRVQLGAVRGGALQLGALDLLRAGEDQLQACGVEAAYIAFYLVYAPSKARVRTLAYFLLLNTTLKLVAPDQFLGTVCLAFSMAGRLRGADQHHREGGEDQERRVHAHRPVLLPPASAPSPVSATDSSPRTRTSW